MTPWLLAESSAQPRDLRVCGCKGAPSIARRAGRVLEARKDGKEARTQGRGARDRGGRGQRGRREKREEG